MTETHIEDEPTWLRFFIRRLRNALRYAKDPRVNSVIRELITEAETRLAEIVARRNAGKQC
jgi:hypothetical protein